MRRLPIDPLIPPYSRLDATFSHRYAWPLCVPSSRVYGLTQPWSSSGVNCICSCNHISEKGRWGGEGGALDVGIDKVSVLL